MEDLGLERGRRCNANKFEGRNDVTQNVAYWDASGYRRSFDSGKQVNKIDCISSVTKIFVITVSVPSPGTEE